MTETISKRNILNRMAVILLSFGFCAFSGMAQNNFPEMLNHVMETQDMETGIKLYHEITEEDLRHFPDSALFDYHYLGGYINSEIHNHEKAVAHLMQAKRLCETSLGVHSISYQEIMRGLGDEYVELQQYEEAVAICQEGIVKTMYIRNNITRGFSNLIMRLQSCYEFLGSFNEIPMHLKDVWIFWPKDEEPLETYTYFPLWSLEQFYKRYGMYDNALSISRQIETFIKSKGGENHPELADALYMKGNILVDMNRTNDGIEAYQEGLAILRDNGMVNTKLYGQLAGNLLMQLISRERFDESDVVLESIRQYSINSNNPERYKDALFSVANRIAEMGKYAKALSFYNELLKLNITDEERSIIENQRNTTQYNKSVVDNLSGLENDFDCMQIGSPDWFETGHKLSSAYYLIKAQDKNTNVLIRMYNAIDLSKSIGTDYYVWILNNLIGASFDKNENQSAFKYASERWDYLSRLTEVPESYLFNSLNDLIVAKMKSNNLDGIDSNLEKIEKFCRTQYGEESSKYAVYLHNRGRAYQLQNKLNEARNTLLRSITVQNKVTGKSIDKTFKYYMEVEQQLGEL